jgi:hypothetical protein
MVVAAVCVLMLVAMIRSPETSRLESTSHGIGPFGYRALYDSLARLGVPVARGASADAPEGTTVWWLGAGICRERDDPYPWAGLDLARRGGTAVAMLAADFRRTCHLGEGLRLDVRPRRAADASGPLAPASRRLAPRPKGDPRVQTLKRVAGWRRVLRTGHAPLVVERRWGTGRLVVVADARLFSNQALERGDHAMLALDLVRAYGVPVFDEVAALRQARGVLAYLASSAAAPVFLGLAALGLLVAWHGTLVPARTLPPLADPTPRLGTFVDSIATLYARTRDYGRAFDRYRDLATGALRRHFSLAPDVPAEVVISRARQLRPDLHDDFEILASGKTVGDAGTLRSATASLDRLVKEVCR